MNPTFFMAPINVDSEKSSRLIFNNSFGCLKILDLQGNLVEMNKGGQDALEVDDFQKIKGHPWASLWPLEFQAEVAHAVETARAGARAHFVGYCPTAKGTPKWWTVDVSALRDHNGNFDALLATSHDVSELQRIRFELEEINLRRDLLMRAGEIGEWSVNLETGTAICASTHDRCFGFDRPVEQWTFDRFISMIHRDDCLRVETRIRKAIEKNEILHDEFRIIWPDGIVHWIASIGMVYSSKGMSRRWLGVVQDITKRKQVEAVEIGKKLALEKMVEGLTLADVLESLCRSAEERFGEIVFSCILTADADNKMLHRIASPSLPPIFSSSVNEMPISASSGACGKAAYLRQEIYIDSIEDSNLSDELKELARQCGIKSCWTTPIISTERKLLGTFAMYYKRRPLSVDNDRSSVAEIVNTIGLIMERFRHDEEKSRLEIAFREAQTRLATTLKAVEVATWSYDIQKDEMYGDDNLRRMLSFNAANVSGAPLSSFLDSVHPEDRSLLKNLMDDAILAGLQFETRYRLRSADGIYHTVLTRFNVEQDVNDHALKLFGVMLDITRQQQAEDHLTASRERYYQLFRMMGQGLCIVEVLCDENGRPYDCLYLETNPAFAECTGMHDVTGKTFRSVIPFISDFWINICSNVMASGNPCKIEHESKILGRWFDVYASSVDEGKKLVSILFTDITARKNQERIVRDFNYKLDREANYDALTGLPNRRLFLDRLTQEIYARTRDQKTLYLLFLDLDNFKEVNDLFGHSVGDELLKEISRRLRNCVRMEDTVARLGGDEFTVILAKKNGSHVEWVAQKILEKVSEVVELGNEHIRVTCSIGITAYPNDCDNREALIRNADQAMYLAKANGRNQLSFFENSMHIEAMLRLKTIHELQDALARNEMVIYFQPILDLRTGMISKAEVLIRWNHPSRGLLLPGNFIALAEETGIIHGIGDWVFKETLAYIKRWKHELGIDMQLSINKSPKQFLKKGHTDEWLNFFRESGVSGENVVVEITEGVLINNSDFVSENLRELHDRGIEISIDDFGTGYSSLGYLKRLNANYIKLDQSFIRNLNTDATDTIIIETIILMGHKLGMKIIAEGVENQRQMDWLKFNDCDFVQGFLVSKALALEEFEKVLKAQAESP